MSRSLASLKGSSVMSSVDERAGPPEPAAHRDAAAMTEKAPPGEVLSLQEARRRFERDMIREALERNDWNISRAADELGLERTNLHKKLKSYGLARHPRE